MTYTDEDWKPTRVRRAGLSEDTSTGVTQVLTDCGWAYCKALGNRQGPHVLACEWVCLRLARWLGLPTFRGAIIHLDEDATFPLPEHGGRKYHAQSGPCFVTRGTPGRKWDGTPQDLDRLLNPHDVAKLVVFDTWVLNRDRHYPDYAARRPNYGNVFFAAEEDVADKFVLVAMDHTHCFDNGVLHARLDNIGYAKDERLYGLFPEFRPRVSPAGIHTVLDRLRQVERSDVEPILTDVPAEWEVDAQARGACLELIVSRARYLCEALPATVRAALGAGPESTAGGE
jgi:hypothetical protein